MKIKAFFLVAMPVLFSAVGYANIGGMNYDIGSYVCSNLDQELEASFSYPTRTTDMIAEITVKGQKANLDCVSARESSAEFLQVFRDRYSRPSHICTGQAKKGTLLVGTTNSMGAIQMKAYMLDARLKVLAESTLNCSSAPEKKDSGW